MDRNGAVCIACNNAAPLSYVREQARVGNMGEQMTAIVAEGDRRPVITCHQPMNISKRQYPLNLLGDQQGICRTTRWVLEFRDTDSPIGINFSQTSTHCVDHIQ